MAQGPYGKADLGIETIGGDKIGVQYDLASSDYFALEVNGVGLKMDQKDLNNLINLLSNVGKARIQVK